MMFSRAQVMLRKHGAIIYHYIYYVHAATNFSSDK